MAMIEKMSIAGIRSYPPDSAGVIEFQKPLTLIVGPNGTGKTSIIESLNFIVTGDFPPGCKGQAFIHDPKVAGEKEVKGQVKLRFRDITGNRINCIRSMSSTQKQKKIETKSLEGVIMKETASGERESISSRCTDFTKEMISRLGVSKAVIQNVIFCHQEDANWPLSEGKTLKQRFDAIFAATRYIKALESIRNLRKDQAQDVKKYNTELGYLTQTKDKAQEICSDLAKAEGQVAVSKDQIKKITASLQPIETHLAELDSVSEDVFRVEKDIGNLNSTKDQLSKNVADLGRKVKNMFDGSYEELLKLRSEFADRLSHKETDLYDLQTIVRRINMEVDRLSESRTTLMKEHGKLQQEAETCKAWITDRDQLIKDISHKYDMPGFESGHYTASQTDLFMRKMKEIYSSTVNNGKDSREHFNKDLQDIEAKINNLRKSLHGHEGGIEQKQKIIRTNSAKLSEINSSLSSLAASENRLQSLALELKRAETELEDFKSEMDLSTIDSEINSTGKEKKKQEKELVQLREEEGLMIQQSKAQTKVDMLRKDKANKEDTIQNILRRHEETLETIFDTRPPVEELKSKLSRFLRNKQVELRKQSQEYQNVNQVVAAKESKRKMMQDELHEKELKVSQSKQRLDETCAENDFNEFREMVQMRVEKHSNNLVEIGAFEKIYQKYLRELSNETSDDKGCPLCHRKFTSQREVRNLVEELSQKLENVPEKREENQGALEEQKTLSERLIRLLPVKSVFDSLSDELPKLKKKISDLNKEIETVKSKLSKIEEAKITLEQHEKSARVVEADINRIDDNLFELKDLDRQLNIESSKLQGIVPGRTMKTVRTEVQEKQVLVDSLSRKIEQKQQQLMENQRQLGIRERDANELRSQKLKLESELQKRLQLEGQKAELMSTNQAYEREIREATSQLEPVRAALKDHMEEKKDLELNRETNEEETRGKLNEIKTFGNKVYERSDAIQKYVEQGKEKDVEDNEEQLKLVERRLKQKADEREKKKSDISKIQDEITKQDLRKREIEDNMQLMKTKKEIEQINIRITQLKEELNQFGDYQELSKQRANLQEQLDKYRRDKSNIEGRLRGFEDEVKRWKRDLTSSMYADAETQHCQKLIEMRTTELAGQDLDKYYKALDRAIMKYHGLKLEEINKIIEEYWVKTYRGRDIDTIKVIAENDEEGSGASKSRRTYNYRVCMVKGQTTLDMRGRCSAGQKVLASIIIRLALAETFCLNCGILALDEPTTNLDEDNVESLANSLKDIIELRMQQKNFQILIITHDEGFVQALGRSDYVEYFFRVYKDDNGHSRIHRNLMEIRE